MRSLIAPLCRCPQIILPIKSKRPSFDDKLLRSSHVCAVGVVSTRELHRSRLHLDVGLKERYFRGWNHCCCFSSCSELLPVTISDDKLSLRVRGLVTNANYSNKKLTFLLFINRKSNFGIFFLFSFLIFYDILSVFLDRLVDSTSLRKALTLTYSAYLPKHSHPFIYLRYVLEINLQFHTAYLNLSRVHYIPTGLLSA